MKYLIIIAFLLTASSGYAQTVEPGPQDEPATADAVTIVPTPKSERAEFFYAPAAHSTALQITYAQTPLYKTQTSTLPSGNYANDVSTSTSSVLFRAQHSITKNLALSLDLGYRKDQNEFTNGGSGLSAKASGMKDIGIGALYQLPTSFARYYFALNGSFSQQRSEIASTKIDGNETTGGWNLRPSIGITKRLFTPNLRAGLELAQTIRGKRTQGDNQLPENDITTTGGGITNLNLFAEYKYQQLLLAALRLSASRIAQETVSASGGTTFSGNAEAYATYGIGLDGYYYLNPWLTFKLGYEGTQFPARVLNDNSGTTQVFVSAFSGSARFTF